MAQVFARLMHDDGKYHYGTATGSTPHLGPLFAITATGGGTLPTAQLKPATKDEHQQWLTSLERNGFNVIVVPVEERVS